MAYYPKPNVTASSAVGLNNYFSSYPSTDSYDSEFALLDIVAGNSDKLFFDFLIIYRLQATSIISITRQPVLP